MEISQVKNKRPFDNSSTLRRGSPRLSLRLRSGQGSGQAGLRTPLPTIGITCLDDRPTLDQHAPRFGQSQTYFHAVAKAGAAPLLIPNLIDKTSLRTLYELLDGLLLAGGEDVDQAQIQGSDKHDYRYPGYPRNRLSHTVTVAPQMHLAHILGLLNSPDPLYWVNSSHHQAIKDVAPGLTVAACAPDDIIEAVEAEAHPFAIGVQWHPEELADNDVQAQRIFDALVEAVRDRLRNGE
jgi:gamma-glutamyl-gamma-aminobutyrate hydrolase PuuD